ncbi:MAG: hypothetical protein OXC08_18825 [Thiotrichales bacterium]|nr:hypothetical protein [Thiotrichales bacterium]
MTDAERKPRPTIEELEAMLEHAEECPIEILPNGDIRQREGTDRVLKPLTMRQNLGGEYGCSL